MPHGVEVAKFFGAPYIRLFSFFIPEGEDPTPYRNEVIARTKAMVELAEAGGVTLLHENEKDIFGDTPERVADLIATIDSPNYRGIFDPANYVQCGVRPFDEAYPIVRPVTDYIHCKDALAPTGSDDLGRWCPRARVTASSVRCSPRCATPATTASSRSSRIWATSMPSVACAALSCGRLLTPH